jgi:phage shock protein A
MRQLLAGLLDALADLKRGTSMPMASLDRSIAAAGHAHTSARRALAVAMAEERRETDRRAALTAKVSELEKRAVDALRAGREDLAIQASEAIASIATEVDASARASQRFAAEVALARREVDAQRRRLSELDRGRRLARIGHALTVTTHASRNRLDSFTEAEAALAQVVAENQDARFVQEEMAPPAEYLIERLSDAGFGDPMHVRASDVLVRLRAAAAGPSHLIESLSDAQ